MATRKQSFNTALIYKYKQYRNKLTDIIKKQKLEFYGEIVKKTVEILKRYRKITTQPQYRSQNYKININNSIHDYRD